MLCPHRRTPRERSGAKAELRATTMCRWRADFAWTSRVWAWVGRMPRSTVSGDVWEAWARSLLGSRVKGQAAAGLHGVSLPPLEAWP